LPARSDCTHAHSVYLNLWRAGRTDRLVESAGTVRRIQALMVLGWTAQLIGEYAGSSEDSVRVLLRRQGKCRASTARRIAAAYRQLSMTPGPSNRGRIAALGKGWVPPLAWDNIDRDPRPPAVATVSQLHADVDQVVVLRALNGQRVKANPAERSEVIRRWEASGRPLNELERLQGWAIWRDRREAA
jgi:hypothetical protein